MGTLKTIQEKINKGMVALKKADLVNKAKYGLKKSLEILEKADSVIFGRFDNKLKEMGENDKYVPSHKVKTNHDYIVDYMVAGSKEEMDIALSHMPKNYPFE